MNGGDGTFIDGLLEKNPQIRYISVDNNVDGFLEKISQMPQLEHLNLIRFKSIMTEIRLENIRNLTIGGSPYIDLRNLFFPKLQELKTHLYPWHTHIWMTFFGYHVNLKRLRFHVINIAKSQFTQFMSTLHHLEEMSFYGLGEHYSSIEVDEIIEFMESHEKLIKLFLDKCSKTDKEILRSKFSCKWTISECDDGLLLERELERKN